MSRVKLAANRMGGLVVKKIMLPLPPAMRALVEDGYYLLKDRELMHQEVKAVLQIMDDHASVWGDEGVFRRCRDRLRKLVSEPIETVPDMEFTQEPI